MTNFKLTKPQENKFSMFKDLESILERNKSIVDRIPQLADSTAKFKDVISQISIKAVMKNTVLKGSVITKTNKRIELESAIIENSSALYAFGAKSENEMIKAIANVNVSSLDRLRDTDIINKATSILDAIVNNSDALSSFAVTVEDINNLRNCINNYRSSSSETSSSKTDSMIITKSLQEFFQTGTYILNDEIDKIVDSLKTKEKNFYDSYYAARSIKNLGIRHKKQLPGQAPLTSGS